MSGQFVVLDTAKNAGAEAARRFAQMARAAVATRKRFVVALSGGSTPNSMYRHLVAPPLRDVVPWDKTHVFWSDERYVPVDHPDSNARAATEALLDKVPVPPDQVHRVPTALDPPAAGEAYSATLRRVLSGAEDDYAGLDLVMLGLGSDGHVASLFPSSQALVADERGALAHWVVAQDGWRITLTYPEINAARHVMGLVTGPSKALAVADLRAGLGSSPAVGVAPSDGDLLWVLDAEAEQGSDAFQMKRAAAQSAALRVESGMRLGLGTGSTTRLFLLALAERLRGGTLHGIVGVPTSTETASLARNLSIPITDLEPSARLGYRVRLDLAVDGADEVSHSLDLIKGGGGALLREKIVAACAERFLVIADASKEVEHLGSTHPLPVEVTPFGWSTHLSSVADLGGTAGLRMRGGRPFRTDGGNYILDCRFPGGIADPEAVDRVLCRQPGVVETGLFLGLADEVLVGRPEGVVQLARD